MWFSCALMQRVPSGTVYAGGCLVMARNLIACSVSVLVCSNVDSCEIVGLSRKCADVMVIVMARVQSFVSFNVVCP